MVRRELRVTPRRLLVWLFASGALLSCLACAQRERCEEGLCPAGMTCSAETGRCETLDSADLSLKTGIFGSFMALPLAGLRQGFLGRANDRQSLVWLERGADRSTTIFIAGPGEGDKGGAPVQAFAAAAAADGRIHVAFTRGLSSGLWYASRGEGAWKVERLLGTEDGVAGDALAIAVWLGRPAIVYRTEPEHHLALIWRQADGSWDQEPIALPAAVVKDQEVQLGTYISMSAWKDNLSVVTYDAVAGDLVVSVRKASVWKSGRLAGAEGGSGPVGDLGLPGDLARSSTGDLIIAYRDRGRNHVRLLRSEAGKIVDSLVSDGGYLVADGGQRRRVLLGTALSLAVLDDGRVAVACQDASRARLQVFVQKSVAGFEALDVPHHGHPQAWPRLFVQSDGSLVLAWVEMDSGSAPPMGSLQTWTVPLEATRP